MFLVNIVLISVGGILRSRIARTQVYACLVVVGMLNIFPKSCPLGLMLLGAGDFPMESGTCKYGTGEGNPELWKWI